MRGSVLAGVDREVRVALVAVLIARLAVNGGLRVVYPFLPEIARGLGVSFATASALVALRSFAGLAAPAVARPAERWGRRSLMLGAVVAVGVGCLLTAAAPSLAGAAAGFLLVGLVKPVFDVPMQAWFSARVPYARRGRVLGIAELTWALSLLVTVPLSGVLIATFDWRAPFLLVAALAVAGAVAVARLIAPDRPAAPTRRPLQLTRERLTLLAVVLLFAVASELLFVVYGAWLEDDLGFGVTAIGLFTGVVVLAELVGEGGVAAIADRLGPRRMIFIGLVISAVAYASLGLVGGSLVAAIVAVTGWFVGFEITVVATTPLATELAGDARERLLALIIAAIAGARGIGALLAPPVYGVAGIASSGLVAAALALLAAGLLTRVPDPAVQPAAQ